ncbi:unnamed protein product [Adineta steineri]|uniref:C2 domain-containing protein n=1 Tax=Adineta steineri TaxID=433720 RepID=A0A819J2A6_9BILA|nr:unnamed protein product [Adineta steineri]CAF3926369.1 unnamed protein product [Adineta steineri]
MAQLQVTVVEAKNIKRKDFFSESDPFVQVYLDNKNNKQKTKVKRNTKNPQWDEILVLNHLKGQDFLYVDICDKDPLKDDIIGSIKIDLSDLYETNHIDNWFTIPAKDEKKSKRGKKSKVGTKSCGELHLIFDYQPLKV